MTEETTGTGESQGDDTTQDTMQSVVESTQAKIAEDIAAAEQDQEDDDTGLGDEEEEGEEGDAEVEEEEDGEGDSDDDSSPMVPRSRLNHKTEMLKEAERKAAIMEDRYNQLLELVEQQYGGGSDDGAEGDDYEPLDPEMDKKHSEEIEKLREEMRQQNFIHSLEAEQARAEAKYPDFNEAYAHYVHNIADAIGDDLKERGKEVSKDKLLLEAQHQLSVAMQKRHADGLPMGDWIYKQAKRAGWQAQDSKKGLNHEAIERNRKKTEKRTTEKARPEKAVGTSDGEAHRKKYYSNGVFDINKFKKDTQDLIASAS